MKLIYIRLRLLFVAFLISNSYSQETLPIYQDYLSDNVYLLHPSAAGIGNSSKLRLTARRQWAGIPNAPELQTLSFHSRFSEYSNAGYGFMMFNDQNGFHSQKGFQGSYAYHLPMSTAKVFNQLSFGLAFTFVQNQSDQRTFTGDPNVAAVIASTSYFNADFSVAYHLKGFSSYFTVKNLFLTAKNAQNVSESLDLRNYILSAGYYFWEDKSIQLEPSVMIQLRQGTGERIADVNLKAYKNFGKSTLWAALSYRRNFDSTTLEDAQFVSPIIGINYKNYMFSYTYTQQMNDVLLTNSGFHQISLGINLWTREPRAAACPNINSPSGRF
ncbi:MAG: type IX secretion system membrane protein PorP/SprF [Polaribacter sp.]